MEYVQWLHESDWKILRVYGTPSPKCPQITLNQKTTKMKKKKCIYMLQINVLQELDLDLIYLFDNN